jgi:hypothetical protein
MGTLTNLSLAADLLVEPDLDQLRQKAAKVEDLVTPPRSLEERLSDPGADLRRTERRAAWFRQVEDAVLDLSNAMPRGVEDYDVRKLLGFVVDLRRRLEADPDASDSDGAVDLATLQMADVVGRVRRRLLHEELDDPTAAVQFTLGALSGVGVSEISKLLGVSTKTTGAWRQGAPVKQNARRVVLVAQVISYLRASMTARGVLMWFESERDQLGMRTPLELLNDEEASAHASLVGLARASRGQLAD